MRLIIINIIMALLSLFIFGFGAWTYGESLHHDKVRKYFTEKTITKIQDLKTASILSDKMVIIQGKIVFGETFLSRNNKKVVLERYKEEFKYKDSNKDWKDIKDNSIFKVIPFKIEENSNYVLIDPYSVDKTFLGNAETKTEEIDNKIIKKSLWTFEPNQKVYILGAIQNKAGQMVIDNPNLYKSVFSSLWEKEPFIITNMEPAEVANKAKELGKSIYFASLALFLVGAFTLVMSVVKIFRTKPL